MNSKMNKQRMGLITGAIVGLVALMWLLWQALDHNPRVVPSVLVGRSAPEFSIPDLYQPQRNRTHAELTGQWTVVHFWATWCPECRTEHSQICDWKAREPAIHWMGILHRDNPDKGIAYLKNGGDPYHISAIDGGDAGVEWAVSGVPESFLVDPKGVIRAHHAGALTPEIWDTWRNWATAPAAS